jgi:8-oxo-dGTP pyrophosphatase MutT (NUDIX family)
MSEIENAIDLQALRARCQHALPGFAAHSRFAPEMAFGRHRGPVAKNAHGAAVIVALCETPSGLGIPLTVRSDKVGEHRGQISLPGGRLEPNESDWHAAIREFQEELGANSDNLELLTPLTPVYVFASNHRVQPFLTIYRGKAEFTPSESEVTRVLMLSADDLLNDDLRIVGTMQRGTCQYDAPGFRVEDQFVWGATALILGELAALLAQSVS